MEFPVSSGTGEVKESALPAMFRILVPRLLACTAGDVSEGVVRHARTAAANERGAKETGEPVRRRQA